MCQMHLNRCIGTAKKQYYFSQFPKYKKRYKENLEFIQSYYR